MLGERCHLLDLPSSKQASWQEAGGGGPTEPEGFGERGSHIQHWVRAPRLSCAAPQPSSVPFNQEAGEQVPPLPGAQKPPPKVTLSPLSSSHFISNTEKS